MHHFPPTYCCWKSHFTHVDPRGYFQPHVLMFYDSFCLDSLLPGIASLSRCEQCRTKSEAAVIRACKIQPECSGPWRGWTPPVWLAKYSELHSATSLCSLLLKKRGEDKRKFIWEFWKLIWVVLVPCQESILPQRFSAQSLLTQRNVSPATCACEFIYRKQCLCPYLLGKITGLMCTCTIWGPSWCSSKILAWSLFVSRFRKGTHLIWLTWKFPCEWFVLS